MALQPVVAVNSNERLEMKSDVMIVKANAGT